MTHVFMFTGKGGVGKTTCSAATALYHADAGPTLAISTDATPSLSHIFELAGRPQPAEVVPGLRIREIGETEVREMWDRKFGREVHEVFSAFVDIDYESFVEFMTSVLPGLGEEFMVDYIRELALTGEYETIVWDTAPLGQTLGLLETPALLGNHLRMAPRIYSRLRLGRRSREPVLDILKRWEALSAENMEFLQNGVDFTMVTIPEALAVEQLAGVFHEMGKYGLSVKRIVVNNVIKTEESEFTRTKARQQRGYLEHIRTAYGHLKITELPMFPQEVKGVERLREIGKYLFA
ncbi:MAG: ArsA family ATPase [Dehalococcoidales bacterium]|nr:ArsA family ATPase [Dehalococcoidales bacterium]